MNITIEKTKPKLSIIVPIYKIEPYIEQCIDSIVNQVYKNIEIILVDDGSPDKCGEICDNYAKKDSRIIVIHKKNGGLSSARNAGIKIANGEYIVFVDGDDYYRDEKCLLDVVEILEETSPDILLIPLMLFYEDFNKLKYVDKHYNRERIRNCNKSDAMKYAMKYDFFKACACDKIVKKKIIHDNNLLFLDNMLSEDIDWCAELFIHSQTFDCIERPIYVYRQRQGSITKSITYKHMQDIFFQVKKWAKVARQNNDKLLNGYLAHNYVMLIETYNKVDVAEKKGAIKEIKKFSYLLDYDYSLNVSKVKKVYKILGIRLTALILKLYRSKN